MKRRGERVKKNAKNIVFNALKAVLIYDYIFLFFFFYFVSFYFKFNPLPIKKKICSNIIQNQL